MFSLPVKQTDTSVIPKGPYCYKVVGMQANGFCSYLQLGDWMKGGTFLLWDAVKECNINEDE